MKIFKNHIYTVDLNPRFGIESGEVRPVVVVQTDLLNNIHPSTIICPITSQLSNGTEILRVRIKKESGLKMDSEIIVDQVRAIDNKRFIKDIGELSEEVKIKLYRNIKIVSGSLISAPVLVA